MHFNREQWQDFKTAPHFSMHLCSSCKNYKNISPEKLKSILVWMEDFGGAFRVKMCFSHSLEAKCSRGKRAHCVCVRNNRMLAPLVTVNWKDTHYKLM